MILTEQKPFSEILEMLERARKIAVIGCGGCAAKAGTGDSAAVYEMANRLECAGKEIKYKFVFDASICYAPLSKDIFELPGEIKELDAILLLSCGSGVQALNDIAADLNLNKIDIFPGLNTKKVGAGPMNEVLYEKCMGCGDCVLHITGGICPVTLCPKNKILGPCGDEIEGKCQASGEDRTCVWSLIYKKLRDKGENIDELLNKLSVFEKKDWSKGRLTKIDLMKI